MNICDLLKLMLFKIDILSFIFSSQSEMSRRHIDERRGMLFNLMIILKIATVCNLNCSYCYWFRDPEVQSREKFISLETTNKLINRIDEHLQNYEGKIGLTLHGGEPLLLSKEKISYLLEETKKIQDQYPNRLSISLTTNGTRIDDEYASIIKNFNVSVAVSVDGPKEIHNKNRVDHKGNGSYDDVIRGLDILKKRGIDAYPLMVYSPGMVAQNIVSFVTQELKFSDFDVLIPDHTWDDQSVSDISEFYIDLINYTVSHSNQFRIRQVDHFFREVAEDLRREELGSKKAVGFKSPHVISVLPDGAIEINDIFRITQLGRYSDNLNIFTNRFSDIQTSPVFTEIESAWQKPADTCLECEHVGACQGGHVAHRYSKSNRFDNPSRHCEALKKIYTHVKNLIQKYKNK